MGKCTNCGKDAGFIYSLCPQCIEIDTRKASSRPAGDLSSGQASGTTAADEAQGDVIPISVRKTQIPVVNRYRDGYRVATFLVAVGNTVKVIGAGSGVVIFLVLASAGQQFGSGAGALVGLVFGGIAAGIGFVLGVLVSAQGQILRATLDTSVSASHFMTDHERTVAMSLPASVAESERNAA